MYLQQYKRAKKAILALLEMNHDSLPTDEILSNLLSQEEGLKRIQLAEFRDLAIHTFHSFQAVKEAFSECSFADFRSAHERIMRFIPTQGQTEESEYAELLGRYTRISNRLAQQQGAQVAQARFELKILSDLQYEARQQAALRGEWVVPDGSLGKAKRHSDIVCAVTQKYPTVGLEGVCHGLSLTAAAKILTSGYFDREAFLEAAQTSSQIDKIAIAQAYQEGSGATIPRLLEALEPGLISQVYSMPGLLVKNERMSIWTYVNNLNQIPSGFPIAIVLTSFGLKGSHSILLYHDEQSRWQAFDSNQMTSVARTSLGLMTILEQAFSELDSLAFFETICTVGRSNADSFSQRQTAKHDSIVKFLRDEPNQQRKDVLFFLTKYNKDHDLTVFLLQGGVNPNSYDLSVLTDYVTSGNLVGLHTCFMERDGATSVTTANMKALLQVSILPNALVSKSLKERITSYLGQEIKGREVLLACENSGDVHFALMSAPLPLLSRHALKVREHLKWMPSGEFRTECIDVFNAQNPGYSIKAEEDELTRVFSLSNSS